MIAGMGNDVVEEIKSRCNIVDVISHVVTLKKAGANHKGLCPFHKEKTPSFVVSESKQFYHCFGCGESGDVINFVQKYYNLDFMGAVERLADEYGIQFERNFEKNEKKKIYYDINVEAARFFYRAFREGQNEAGKYMDARQIKEATLRKFGIGYADNGWTSLFDYLRKKGFADEDMMSLGLISEKNGKRYDKFRNRVMFPIQNTNGKVIGFGGRIIDEGEPKYLNSPESAVFYKKDNLYGLNVTSREISESNRAILVEGYMDVISLYESGVRNVTASLGTALTQNQARMLKRYSTNVVISYDGDAAGVKAALRAMDILYREGCKVKVLHIAGGADPDDFVRTKGREAYLKAVEDAPGLVEYKFNRLKEIHDMESTDGRVEFLKDAVEALRQLRPAERDIRIKQLAEDVGISEGAIRAELKDEPDEYSATPERLKPKELTKISKKASFTEKTIIKIMMMSPEYIKKKKEVEDLFKSVDGTVILEAIEQVYEREGSVEQKKVADLLPHDEANLLREIVKNISLGGQEEKIFEDCKRKSEKFRMEKKSEELRAKISMADEEENKEAITEWTKELMEIQKESRMGVMKNEQH